jgi:hypothetical protein
MPTKRDDVGPHRYQPLADARLRRLIVAPFRCGSTPGYQSAGKSSVKRGRKRGFGVMRAPPMRRADRHGLVLMVLITDLTTGYVIMVASGRSVGSPARRGSTGADRV